MIKVTNLDRAHNDLTDLIIKENQNGADILNRTKDLIMSLSNHWVGEDATKNINKLINVHQKLQTYMLTTLESTKLGLESITKLQEVRKANGGGGQVGDIYSTDTSFACIINELPQTSEYFVDPEIRNDYNTLCSIEDDAFDFAVFEVKLEIMNNWQNGNNRDKIKADFDEIITASTTLENTISEVKQEINTVVNNVDQVMN